MQARTLVPHSAEVGITIYGETAHPSLSLAVHAPATATMGDETAPNTRLCDCASYHAYRCQYLYYAGCQ